MFRGKSFLIVTLVLTFLFGMLQSEVSLRVLMKPPMVTLECLIMNPVEKASAIMWCPNDIMCFTGCIRLCKTDCSQNKISCKETTITNGLKYTYTFDTTISFNQGEWTCNFGTQRSSTVIFFNETKGNMPILTNLLRSETMSSKLPLFSTSTTKNSHLRNNKVKANALVNPLYVIVLLTAFALSLFLNIILIVRSILYRFSTKRSILSTNLKEKSCFLKMCIRLFCVQKYFKIKGQPKSKFPPDDNYLLFRQTSNNIYECAGLSNIHPAILHDNCGYIGTPINQRLLSQTMFSRSHSFPAKDIYQKLNGKVGESNVLSSPIVRPHFTQLISPQESVSQIIYDDVAEPSNSYIPSNYFTSLNRPHKSMSFNSTFNDRLSKIAMSINNLTITRPPGITQDGNDQNILKDEINSRVELSKVMIIQADSLLKQADTLLNDKEQK